MQHLAETNLARAMFVRANPGTSAWAATTGSGAGRRALSSPRRPRGQHCTRRRAGHRSPRSCPHFLDMLAVRVNTHERSLTCLECNSRWGRRSDWGEQVRPTGDIVAGTGPRCVRCGAEMRPAATRRTISSWVRLVPHLPRDARDGGRQRRPGPSHENAGGVVLIRGCDARDAEESRRGVDRRREPSCAGPELPISTLSVGVANVPELDSKAARARVMVSRVYHEVEQGEQVGWF